MRAAGGSLGGGNRFLRLQLVISNMSWGRDGPTSSLSSRDRLQMLEFSSRLSLMP